jgi:outer membrane protein assembly factor BamB
MNFFTIKKSQKLEVPKMIKERAFCLVLAMAGLIMITGPLWGAQGDLLWEQQLTFLPQYDYININSVALSSTTYIISGTAGATNQPGVQGFGFIRAFDVATGNIKWEKTLSLGTYTNAFGEVVIYGNIALVRAAYSNCTITPGNPSTYNFTLFKYLLQAYNADTGQFLWENVQDFETSKVSSQSAPLLTGNNRVFFTYAKVNSDGTRDESTCFVRAFQIKNVMVPTSLLLEKK